MHRVEHALGQLFNVGHPDVAEASPHSRFDLRDLDTPLRQAFHAGLAWLTRLSTIKREMEDRYGRRVCGVVTTGGYRLDLLTRGGLDGTGPIVSTSGIFAETVALLDE